MALHGCVSNKTLKTIRPFHPQSLASLKQKVDKMTYYYDKEQHTVSTGGN